jgi:hypothetical protein
MSLNDACNSHLQFTVQYALHGGVAARAASNQRNCIMNLPQTMVFEHQPYGRVVLGNLELDSYNGYPCVHGDVLSGYEKSYLWGHTSTKPATGKRTIYGIKQTELDLGLAIRIACG